LQLNRKPKGPTSSLVVSVEVNARLRASDPSS
jgi:hypothetical protein